MHAYLAILGNDSRGGSMRNSVRRSFAAVTIATVSAMAAVLATAAPAAASISGYHVTGTGTDGLRVRTDPYNTTATVVSTLADGTALTIDCAVRGRGVTGNTVWHKISGPVGGWVSDYYTDTPAFNKYIPGEADCNAGQSREQRALAWARAVLGQTSTNGDFGDDNHEWDGWCDNFVAHAYGRPARWCSTTAHRSTAAPATSSSPRATATTSARRRPSAASRSPGRPRRTSAGRTPTRSGPAAEPKAAPLDCEWRRFRL
jgi:hypothetical protein